MSQRVLRRPQTKFDEPGGQGSGDDALLAQFIDGIAVELEQLA